MVSNNYTPEIVNALNDLLRAFFQMNSAADNMAYALDCELDCPIASGIFHEKFAHIFPSETFADKLSEIMIHEGVRPVRQTLKANDSNYDNIILLFEDAYTEMDALKKNILEVIEFLDYNKSCKVFVITLENMAEKASELLHQCDIWRQKAKVYSNSNLPMFDADFESFTKI